jgi:CRP-like cAMP-binding protein
MNTDIRHNRTVLDALIPRLAPLRDLPPPRLQRLIDESSGLDYAPGHYVFRQGDRDAYLFYLLQGELELYSDGKLVSHLRGETQEARFALAQLQPRQLSALPRTTVQVLRVQRDTTCMRDPTIATPSPSMQVSHRAARKTGSPAC